MNPSDGLKRADTAESEEPARVIERLFHELVAEPDSATGELYSVWTAWSRAGKDEFLQALGVMLRELLKLPDLGPLARGFATLCLGWIMQGRLAQVELEAMAREALGLFRQVSEPTGEAEASCLLGQTLQKRGLLSEALREYESAKQIMQRLTQLEPENTNFQRDLSMAHTCIGSAFQAQGQLRDALREYQAYKQIMLQLVQREPDNGDWRRRLSIACIRVGGVLQGDCLPRSVGQPRSRCDRACRARPPHPQAPCSAPASPRRCR
jgi:tetratricopeptide (TPR) repeat protein